MKPRAKTIEPLFDPILDELYRARDAYASEFNFDTDAICDALAPRTKRVPTGLKAPPKSLGKDKNHRAGSRRTGGQKVNVKLAA